MKEEAFKEHLKKTRYIFFMLLLGQISFFVFALIVVGNNIIKNENNLDDIFRISLPLVGIAVMFLSKKIYDNRVAGIKVNDSIEDKLNKYLTFKIIQWALIESGGFIALVAFILTNNYFYSIIFLFLIGYFILLKPAKAQLKTDMKI
jgi:hypothetical protein